MQRAYWGATRCGAASSMEPPNHLLADLINAFISAGLAIEYMAELGDRPVPAILGIRARKPYS